MRITGHSRGAVAWGLDVVEEWAGSGEDRVFAGYTKRYKLADKNASLTAIERCRSGGRQFLGLPA